MKGIWRNNKDKSVVLKTTIDTKNDQNINMSLILENTKVLSAALTVYILVE